MTRLQASFALLAASLALAADVNYVFDIANTEVAPDGFTRAGVIVNGIFPGTLVQANANDTLHITVNNLLNNNTMRQSLTIHWHGLFQKRTATEDGPAFVNQCPVAPEHSYTYDIPLNGQSGTFWYHSHLESQYVDGLRGTLVIYDENDPNIGLYDVDDASTVIALADWYHLPAPMIEAKFLDVSPFDEPIADSGTINGVGRFVGGPEVPWARVNVTAGTRYRFRVINTSGYAQFQFSIAHHNLTIIELDGIAHEPNLFGSFVIYVAQRVSFVLNANQPVANYWIAAPLTEKHLSDNNNLDPNNVFAVLHYEGAPDADPTAPIPSIMNFTNVPTADANSADPTADDSAGGSFAFVASNDLAGPMLEFEMHPVFNAEAPGGDAPADHVIDLKFDHGINETTGDLMWNINGVQYVPPDLPTLLQIIANNETTMAQFMSFNANQNTFVLNFNETVELRIHGGVSGHTHPFHLHGHAFSIVQGAEGPENFVNPPQRDVIGVTGSGVIIRFRADNPGPWFLHCHIDWHLVAGLAVVFAEDPLQQQQGDQSLIIKPQYTELCGIYDALPAELQ